MCYSTFRFKTLSETYLLISDSSWLKLFQDNKIYHIRKAVGGSQIREEGGKSVLDKKMKQ